MDTLPHATSYARLGISKIQGIGVFAVRDIPSGTNIFSDDAVGVHWFDKREVDERVSDPDMMRFYNDFCIVKKGKYGCPINFNSMTIGWYMNEPIAGTEPNTRPDENYDFFATRDIKKGEELTTFYTDFSEPLKRY